MGRLAEPINLADAQSHPSFKYVPQVKEERYRAFLGVPIIYRRQLLGVLVVQQREHRQFDESEESFMVTLATQLAGILSQSQLNAILVSIAKHGSVHWRRLLVSRWQKAGKISHSLRLIWSMRPQRLIAPLNVNV